MQEENHSEDVTRKKYPAQRHELTRHTQGVAQGHTDCKAHFHSVNSYVLIEYITACEMWYTTVMLFSRA